MNWYDKFWWYIGGKPYECDKCKRAIYENWHFCPGCGVEIEF